MGIPTDQLIQAVASEAKIFASAQPQGFQDAWQVITAHLTVNCYSAC